VCSCLAIFLAAHLSAQAPLDLKGKLVYIDQGSLWSKTLPTGTPSEIVGGGENPQWSAASEWLSYDIPGGGSPDTLFVRLMSPPYTTLNFKSEGEVHWSPANEEIAFVARYGLTRIRPNRETKSVQTQVLYHPDPGNRVISFCWSMDGKHLAVLSGDAQTQTLWQVDNASGKAEKISLDADIGSAKFAGWTSDNQRIVMWPNPEGSESIAADGLPLIAVSVTSPSAQAFLKDPVLRYPDFVAFSTKRPELLVISGAYRDSWTNKQLVSANPESGQAALLTDRKVAVAFANWSPDSESIAYVAGPDVGPIKGDAAAKKALDQRHVWSMAANGRSARQLTSDSQYRDEYPVWSKDGRYLLFVRLNTDNRISIWAMESSGATPIKLVDPILTGSTRTANAWFGDYGHVNWGKYLAWSRQ
jgi:WD40 repeat protein